jgi:hypothetical protein
LAGSVPGWTAQNIDAAIAGMLKIIVLALSRLTSAAANERNHSIRSSGEDLTQ